MVFVCFLCERLLSEPFNSMGVHFNYNARGSNSNDYRKRIPLPTPLKFENNYKVEEIIGKLPFKRHV